MIGYIDSIQNEPLQATIESADDDKISVSTNEMFSYHKFYYGCYLLQSLKNATKDFLIQVKMNTIIMTTVSASDGKKRASFFQ